LFVSCQVADQQGLSVYENGTNCRHFPLHAAKSLQRVYSLNDRWASLHRLQRRGGLTMTKRLDGVVTMKRATLLAGSCLCALVVSTAPALALMQVDTIAGDHPTAADIASMKRASSPILSPDGQLVVYTVRWAERDPDATPHDGDTTGGWSTQQQLFLADTQDDDVVQITFADKSASSPTWRPDGNAIAFRRNGVIHQLSLDGGEPEPIDTGAFTPGAFAFMPDGKSIAFLATPPLTDDEKEESWRAGGGFSYGEQWRSAQLCVVDLSTNEVRVVTQSHANIVAFTPSPDGSRFLIVTSPTAEPHDAFILHTARIIDAATGATETTLENKQAIIGQIAWSPNGKYVAYERDSGGLSLLNSLIVQSADGAQRWNAAKKLDPSLAGFAWESDSRTLIAHMLDRTRSTLYRLSRRLKRSADGFRPARHYRSAVVQRRWIIHCVFGVK